MLRGIMSNQSSGGRNLQFTLGKEAVDYKFQRGESDKKPSDCCETEPQVPVLESSELPQKVVKRQSSDTRKLQTALANEALNFQLRRGDRNKKITDDNEMNKRVPVLTPDAPAFIPYNQSFEVENASEIVNIPYTPDRLGDEVICVGNVDSPSFEEKEQYYDASTNMEPLGDSPIITPYLNADTSAISTFQRHLESDEHLERIVYPDQKWRDAEPEYSYADVTTITNSQSQPEPAEHLEPIVYPEQSLEDAEQEDIYKNPNVDTLAVSTFQSQLQLTGKIEPIPYPGGQRDDEREKTPEETEMRTLSNVQSRCEEHLRPNVYPTSYHSIQEECQQDASAKMKVLSVEEDNHQPTSKLQRSLSVRQPRTTRPLLQSSLWNPMNLSPGHHKASNRKLQDNAMGESSGSVIQKPTTKGHNGVIVDTSRQLSAGMSHDDTYKGHFAQGRVNQFAKAYLSDEQLDDGSYIRSYTQKHPELTQARAEFQHKSKQKNSSHPRSSESAQNRQEIRRYLPHNQEINQYPPFKQELPTSYPGHGSSKTKGLQRAVSMRPHTTKNVTDAGVIVRQIEKIERRAPADYQAYLRKPRPIQQTKMQVPANSIGVWKFGEENFFTTVPKVWAVSDCIAHVQNKIGRHGYGDLDLWVRNRCIMLDKKKTLSDYPGLKSLHVVRRPSSRNPHPLYQTSRADDIDPYCDDTRVVMHCGHATSPENLYDYAWQKIQNGATEVTCPAIPDANKPCEHCLKVWEFKSISMLACLSEDEKYLFCEKMFLNWLDKNPDVYLCPVCNEAIRSSCTNVFKCFNCEKDGKTHSFCIKCNRVVYGNTCYQQECQESLPKIRDRLKNCQMRTLVGVPNCPSVRACPKCQRVIEYDEEDSCKHMTCPRNTCGAKFCFICLKVKTDQHYWPCGGAFQPCKPSPVQVI